MLPLSIIINNYNYAPYLRQCIQSAIQQSIPAHEIIVVDDGSTDKSIEIINSYDDQIIAIFQANAGQAAAMNTGFKRSTGEIVLFLDSDDYLEPHAIESILTAWEKKAVKLHYPLWTVDQWSNRINRLPDKHSNLPEGNLLPELLRNGTYLWMPTSGNVYSRKVLSIIFPIPEKDFLISADLYISIHSIRFGEVISLTDPLGNYRIHGDNRFNSTRLLTPNTTALSNRIASHKSRCRILATVAINSNYPLPTTPEVYYTTFYGWFDLILGWKLLGLDAINPFMPRTIKEGIRQRTDQRFSKSPVFKSALLVVFFILRKLPTSFFKLLIFFGKWIEPVLITTTSRIIAQKADSNLHAPTR